ncbi:right-handed parallel beta-helix repeat-containing protein, partial [Priestia aryabhattai]
KFDQAREGVISENSIYNVSSYSNPAYRHEYSAGGIYVDGGKEVVIEHNISSHNDLGIEIASEHHGKQTTNIQVVRNMIYENRFT